MPAPQQRANVAGMVSCLGMARLNVQPPSSVKAAPPPLPTPLVPPCCLHAQEHVGPYPVRLGHKASLRLNGAALHFWFNMISNLGGDLNASVAHTGWLQLPSCCWLLSAALNFNRALFKCCWGRNASLLPAVLPGIPSWNSSSTEPLLINKALSLVGWGGVVLLASCRGSAAMQSCAVFPPAAGTVPDCWAVPGSAQDWAVLL